MAGDKHIPNTKWNVDRIRQAKEMALLGLTDQQMADIMGVSISTMDYWKREKKGFYQALSEGKEQADMKVVNNFYLNCLDRYVEEEEIIVYRGIPKKIKRKKFIQGDKWAQSKWLSLRQKALWSETQKIELTRTNVNINKFDFSGLSDEELKVIKKIGLRQLAEHVNGEDEIRTNGIDQ